MSELFDLHDAAKLLCLSYEDALKLVHSGALAARRLAGGGWVVAKDVVLERLQEKK